MKHLLRLLILLIAPAIVRADDAVKVPDGVHYKPASAKVNDEAKALLRKQFAKETSDENVVSMFDSILICGPGLWHDLKDDEALAKIKQGRVTFEVPVLGEDGKPIRTEKLEGKLFQSRDEILLFWKAFAKRMEFNDLVIRKLNPDELKIFWAMISFDITEPLFVLQSKEHKILVVFTAPDKLKIAWIDDYQHLAMKHEKSK